MKKSILKRKKNKMMTHSYLYNERQITIQSRKNNSGKWEADPCINDTGGLAIYKRAFIPDFDTEDEAVEDAKKAVEELINRIFK